MIIVAIVKKGIININRLLNLELSIPDYQRPYKWTEKNINQLFNDILQASQEGLSEYRIGTIVLHQHDDNRLDIVDGQQRTISLYLIYHVIDKITHLNVEKNNSQISKNYREVKRLYDSLTDEQRHNFKTYMKEQCRVILIIIDNEMEAFQFFDSQNSRGKALEAHDLLKAYHLREMRTDNEQIKINLIEKWESQYSSRLASLFRNYLYRIKTWIKQENTHSFNRDGVELFKGTQINHQFNYIQYHKAAHLFIEKFNNENNQELLGIDELIPFQIDQPILAGRRFFKFTLYYMNLRDKVEKIAIEWVPNSVSPKYTHEQTGTRYVRELFQLLLMYYYDRFGIDERNRLVERIFFTYSYQLRLINQAVYQKSINKYALGNNENLNHKLNFFKEIRNARTPSDIERIILDDINTEDITQKYKADEFSDLREKVGITTYD